MKTNDISTLPKTLEEFMAWEPEDGFKYEWNEGVYTSLKQAQICTDDDICSAKPVLEDFEIRVSDIFA